MTATVHTRQSTQDTTRRGESAVVDVPCGATQAAKCKSCAERARKLRMQQCREGWHLEAELDLTADDPDERQRALMAERADLVQPRDELAELRQDPTLAPARLPACLRRLHLILGLIIIYKNPLSKLG